MKLDPELCRQTMAKARAQSLEHNKVIGARYNGGLLLDPKAHEHMPIGKAK